MRSRRDYLVYQIAYKMTEMSILECEEGKCARGRKRGPFCWINKIIRYIVRADRKSCRCVASPTATPPRVRRPIFHVPRIWQAEISSRPCMHVDSQENGSARWWTRSELFLSDFSESDVSCICIKIRVTYYKNLSFPVDQRLNLYTEDGCNCCKYNWNV